MPRAIDSRTFSRPAIALLSRAVSVGPGTDDVDVDVIRREFARECFRETDDRGLASRVNRFAARADAGRVGRDRDDFAGAARLHSRRDGFAAIEHAAKVDRDHFVPKVRSGLDERHQDVPSGVVHQDVDGSQFSLDAIGGPIASSSLVTSSATAIALAPRGTNFRGGLLGGIELDIRERHLGAFVGEPRRDRAPDSLGGAGYDRDFACEAAHDANPQLAIQPPSIMNGAPVANGASSLARNSAVCAISSALPTRPSTELRWMKFGCSLSGPVIRSTIGV